MTDTGKIKAAVFILTAAFFLFFATSYIAAAAEGSDDEDLLDLDSLGSFDAEQPKGDTGGGFGGVSAIFSGQVLTKIAQDLSIDNDEEFTFSDMSIATAKAAVTVNPKTAVTLQGFFRYEAETNWDDSQGDYEFLLWEGNVRWKLGPVDLTVGQQFVAWGIVDAINPTDQINPRDFDHFLDSELGYGKLPAPMIRSEYYMPKNLKLDLIVLPFFVPARLSFVNQDVALFAHNFPIFFLKSSLRENENWYRVERFLDLWYPEWEQDLDKAMETPHTYEVRTSMPADDFGATEAALRFSGRAGGVDFAACYMYIWDDIPTLHVNPEFLDFFENANRNDGGYSPFPDPNDIDFHLLMDPFRITYHRMHVVGADFGTGIGGVGIRWEGAYTFNKHTYTEQLRTRTKPIANWVLNLDYTFDGNFMVTALWMQSAMLNYTAEMLMPPTYNIAMIGMRKPWLDDKLTTELIAAYDFSYVTLEDWAEAKITGQDGMITPMVTYAIMDPLRISLGANYIFGEKYRLFGMIRDNTRTFVTLKYDF